MHLTIKMRSEPKLIIRSYSGQEQLSKEEIKVFQPAEVSHQWGSN